MIKESVFLEQLQTAIKNNDITLPTLPEVALRVRDAVERENTTAKNIADIVATDAALSARLLQVVNSPLYRARASIDNIQAAVTRMGNRLVRSLVISLIMKQIYQATSDVLDRRFRKLWEDSVQVASISRVLASQLRHLEPEQAMLAGLIHNIGALPILAMAEGVQEIVEDEKQLDRLIDNLSPIVGQQILETWQFPESLVSVAANFQNFQYESEGPASYVDVVIVSRLQVLDNQPRHMEMDWSRIPSFEKVGLEPEIQVVEIEGAEESITEIEGILIS